MDTYYPPQPGFHSATLLYPPKSYDLGANTCPSHWNVAAQCEPEKSLSTGQTMAPQTSLNVSVSEQEGEARDQAATVRVESWRLKTSGTRRCHRICVLEERPRFRTVLCCAKMLNYEAIERIDAQMLARSWQNAS